LLGLVQPAEAKIIYTPTHRLIPNDGHYNLDLNHNGKAEFVLANPSPSLNSSYAATSSVLAYPFKLGQNRVFGRGSLASCLHKGARVGPGGRFSPGDRLMAQMHWFDGSHSVKGQWANGGKGVASRYLGFRFKIGKGTHYGWARLNVVISDSYPGITATLTGYAYETVPNKPIIAGNTRGSEIAVAAASGPAPSATLGRLAAGYPALSTWRRRERFVPSR
jgi:hypothetical protein